MRPMQQAPMAPTHQPVQHHTHHQLLSMAPHQQQHMHHMQHPAITNQRILMGISSQNSNGPIALVNVGLKDQANAIPLTLQNHPSIQQQQQQQQQSIQKSIEQKKAPNEDTGESKDDGSGNQQQGQPNATDTNLANTREKTPMCLVNELARFNKIQHQYRLTGEQGPAHKKCFTVTLMLGEEQFIAEGPSIKKAQHSAASNALSKTWYRQPLPKPTRAIRIPGKCPTGSGGYLPPTVELNALAMKRGEPTVYTFRHAPPATAPAPQQYIAHGFTFPRLFTPRYPTYNRGFHQEPRGVYLVTLKVGEREFIGRGMTGQEARHDAASRALEQLRQLPLPEEMVNSSVAVGDGVGNDAGSAGIDDPNAELKSSVSLVHETALKRGLSVSFDVVSETGKPHIRTFMTRCTVGDKVTLGEGSSKKVSKKRAAELMLEELKRLPPVATNNRNMRLKRKPSATRKKSRNLIKVYQEPRTESDSSDEVNPISRLVQIQQAKREREPMYNIVEEKGAPRRREFIMNVSVGQYSAQGMGPNKKLAKKAAAEALLKTMGYSKPQPQPTKPSIKNSNSVGVGSNGAENKENEGKRKVTFVEVDTNNDTTHNHSQGGTIGRQLVPGLLLVDNGADSKVISGPSVQIVAEELRGQQQPQSNIVSPKEQLKYLAQLLDFEVQFSDFPKGTYKEFLSLVSLSTDPPQVCHGHGPTKSASRDQAALTALRTLSKLGLDSVTNSSKKDKSNATSNSDGNGLHTYNTQIQSNSVINGAMDK